ncbi:energy transducer TonB, partial [Pseudomonas sp. ODNR1LW]|nr:energy transducer TonB [Pseudomonas sp. ODNR1LW]
MLIESRRRAYLNAMQVVNWLPRTELPFAAPSRPELLEPPEALVVASVAPRFSPVRLASPQ